jgi:hypothetical protein
MVTLKRGGRAAGTGESPIVGEAAMLFHPKNVVPRRRLQQRIHFWFSPRSLPWEVVVIVGANFAI